MTTVFLGPTHTDSTSAVAAPAPAMSPSIVGRGERQALIRSRGRARGTRDESGPSEPILSDDDAETSGSKEAVSPQSKSFESGDDGDFGSESGDADAEVGSERESEDGTGSDSSSDSDSGANEDSAPKSLPSRKKTKRASRA